jgi:hypothetical protein
MLRTFPAFLLLLASTLSAQPPADSSRPYLKEANLILSTGLRSREAYTLLKELSGGIGPRLSGSPAAEQAVSWGEQTMRSLGFDNVRRESVMVPHWVRGSKERGAVLHGALRRPIAIAALGGSVATPGRGGITAGVVEVKSFDELRAMGEKARGKIVFFNRPMDPGKFNTFEAYSGAVDQRGGGAIEAAKAGGVAALVRSMTLRQDRSPHTGAMHYVDSIPKVPSAALSTIDADFLDSLLSTGASPKVHLELSCEMLPDVESANVVGELRGSEKPDEVIVIGGHLDSWDKGRGAHDDGAGCVHSIEALRLLKTLGLKPKRTIRAVLFMNEENGLRGGKAYAERDRPGERCMAAFESDAGGFTPRGFSVSTDSLRFQTIARWAPLLEPLEAGEIIRGGGGADISELSRRGVPAIGLRVDGQRYFDYHHSENDTIDKVNDRELELGAIALAIMAYVLAQEGL